MVDHMVAVRQHSLHIALFLKASGTEVAMVVAAHRNGGYPVILGMHQNRAVLGRVIVQHRLQHPVFHFDELQCPVHTLLVSACHNGNGIAHEADTLIQNQAVIGRDLRKGLSSLCKPLLRNVLICKDALDARHLSGNFRVDLLNQGMGMRTAQQLHHQAVLPLRHIIHIDRLAQQQLHSILLANGGIYHPKLFLFHVAPPYCFRLSR